MNFVSHAGIKCDILAFKWLHCVAPEIAVNCNVN